MVPIDSSINSQSMECAIIFKEIDLPETLWRMKSLRNVKVHGWKLNVSDGYDLNAFPLLDKVVSFSRPCLSNGKDVVWLLQRLPAVLKLGCTLDYEFVGSNEERVVAFDFHSILESLKLRCLRNHQYIISFPSTLIKLTLKEFHLPWTALSAIAELECLRILKLRYVSYPGRTWETGDMTFPNLKYFELCGSKSLEQWNANTDSFPCLEQLYFFNTALEGLPPCFGEISSLKKITICSSPKLKSSARWIQEEQLDWGYNVELWVRD